MHVDDVDRQMRSEPVLEQVDYARAGQSRSNAQAVIAPLESSARARVI
jgi:hypothetical protein